MSNFLGIDLGASALKACLIDESGTSLSVARAAYDTHQPAPGHSEQNPPIGAPPCMAHWPIYAPKMVMRWTI